MFFKTRSSTLSFSKLEELAKLYWSEVDLMMWRIFIGRGRDPHVDF